jgi:hypothetical protein
MIGQMSDSNSSSSQIEIIYARYVCKCLMNGKKYGMGSRGKLSQKERKEKYEFFLQIVYKIRKEF